MLRGAADAVNRTVLIVDDADTCTDLLEVALICIPGVDVTCVGTGEEALRRLRAIESPVCAMVTDLNMPVVDGFELIARVRSDERYSGMPIIVISGDVDPRTPDRVRRLGVDAYFAKPYSPASVRRTLENLLDGRASANAQ